MIVLSGVGVPAFVKVVRMDSIPSLLGMFVYKEHTSSVAKMVLGGTCKSLVLLMKSVVSFRYDGSFVTWSCRW